MNSHQWKYTFLLKVGRGYEVINMSREQYGTGTMREFTDKRNGNKKYLCIIHINGEKKTKLFPHNPKGKKDALDWLNHMNQLKSSVENNEQTKLLVMRDTIDNYIEEKKPQKSKNITLKDAIASYIEKYEYPKLKDKIIKRNTYERTLSTFGRIPKSLLSMDIISITKDDLQTALNKMQSAEYANEVNSNKKTAVSAREVNKTYALIKRVLKNELANNRITSNPIDTLERRPVAKTEVQIFSIDDIKRMIGAIYYIEHSPKYSSLRMNLRLLYTLLITTGCRIGEALALKFNDISLEPGNETISITKTLDSHWYSDTSEVGLRINTPKTDRSKIGGNDGTRSIPILSKRLIRLLKNAMPATADKDRFLFATKNKTPISYHNAYKRWQCICIETARKCPHCGTKRPNDWNCVTCGTHVTRRSLQCPKCKTKRPTEWTCPTCGTTVREIHKHPHTCRHTVCSTMIQLGYPITNVAKLLGHSPEIALRIYTHASENYLDEMREMTERLRNKNKAKIEIK